MQLKCMNFYLSSGFIWFGRLIGRHPVYFLIAPFILTALLSTGILRLAYNGNVEYLYSSSNGRAVKSEKIANLLFPVNTSHFTDIARMNQPPLGIIMFVLEKHKRDVLQMPVFKELEILDKIIKNTTIYVDGKNRNYTDLCGKIYDRCTENPVIKIIPRANSLLRRKFRIKYPLDVDPLTYAYQPYALNLGGVTVDERSNVENVTVLRLFYVADSSDLKKTTWIKRWERAVIKEVSRHHFDSIDVLTFSLSSFKTSNLIALISKKLFPMMSVTLIAIALFSMLTCMTNDWVRSKPWLGIAACFSSGLAIVASFGTAFYIGIEYIEINVILPFLIFGTEIDDMYVLIASWRSTNPKDDVEKRMGEAYYKASISITITSFTTIFASCIGLTAPFPAVQIFCAYAAICILFAYFYQITFFGGCMALSGYREKKCLHPFTFRSVCAKKKYSQDESIKEAKHEGKEITMSIFPNYVGRFLSSTATKCCVMVVYLAKLSVALWGLTKLKDGFHETSIVPSNSPSSNSLQIYYKYFTNYSFPFQIILNETVNYADPLVQTSIEKLIKTFESVPNVAESNMTLSWLKFYKVFLNNRVGKFVMSPYNVSDKQDFIDGLRNVFLRIKGAKQFEEDIRFNENYTEITASRFLITGKNLCDRQQETRLLRDLWKTADKLKIPVTIHSTMSKLIEQGIVIREITFQIVWVTALLIMIIFLIFVPSLICAMFVSISVTSTMLETVGFMALWDVNLDMASMIVLILCLGFSINYPTHMCSAFFMSKEKKLDDRMKEALYQVGLPIVQGSISTILAIIILAFNDFYGFVIFFKILFLITLGTFFQAMFVLPIALSSIGDIESKIARSYCM